MSLISRLNLFPIKKIYLHTIPLFFISLGLGKFFLRIVLNYVRRICKFFSTSEPSIQYPLASSDNLKDWVGKKNQDFELSKTKPSITEKRDDGSLSADDVEMVMGRLGIFCHPEGVKLQERFGSDDLSNVFEEKEPSLDEVKGAFEVFDENRDGFIDARELQRVLYSLGLKDNSDMENCQRMILAFDENGDGRIDFNEFVKIMETSFC